ncbi:MAG: CoA-binding protein [Deltaproteobacteria bacterium]|nr:CoA-binding protein [Deltaproteobacteria bacterium]MBW2016852.1 CoA-binding protein [Deltaproteobacteria bacterium]MBW2130446.1 CoA-binding protein [Deltaproteobacteria bacterium]MBW2304532.1 CoA-binding protein [Deltaproteobacteria bacterium]
MQCEIPDCNPPSEEIREILLRCRSIAVMGLSPKEKRDSHRVAKYLLSQGYDIIPVNPGQKEILGRPCYRSLRDIPFRVDMADLFLNPSRVPPVVEEAIEAGISVIWMQIGIVHNEAARKARDSGLTVVMNKCTMQEHRKLLLTGTPPAPFPKA